MTLDLDWLRQVPVTRASARLYYRTVHIPPNGPTDPFRVRPHEGRWPTEWTLYTASAPEVAWAEYCRNQSADVEAADVTGGVGLDPLALTALAPLAVGSPLPQRAMWELTFGFERLADLVSPWGRECVREAGFPLDDLVTDDPAFGACPELAAAAVALNWEAMRVPSAALQDPDAFCVPVFSAGRERLIHAEESVPAASPTVATAYATTYQHGKRPSWLTISPH